MRGTDQLAPVDHGPPGRSSARTRRYLAATGVTVAAVLGVLVASPQAAVARTATLGAYTILACNGSTVGASFGSTIDYGYTSATVSGSSRVSWSGPNPSNARRIDFTDRFIFHPTGLVSVSGTGATITSGTATYTFARTNHWLLEHTYGGIRGVGLITHVGRSTVGSFQFTSSGPCTVEASGTKWLT
jgi:hypothetical protein